MARIKEYYLNNLEYDQNEDDIIQKVLGNSTNYGKIDSMDEVVHQQHYGARRRKGTQRDS